MVLIDDRRRSQQKLDLVARHANFELFHQGRIDPIPLGYIHAIHTARQCYNGQSGNQACF